jgi:3-(methylthio)propanoyl-CoA dehydrogenase
VRRMLLAMKSQTEAMRALAYVVAASMDSARRHPDKAERAKRQGFVDFMIPVVKGWCTETGVEVASTGIQVHGGMGFIEETGAAQYYRDARITTIYEGTTGIQSNDLVGRKIGREAGATAKAVIGMMREADTALAAQGPEFDSLRASFGTAVSEFAECVDWIVANYANDAKAVHAVSVPFLMLTGVVAGGWQMVRAALAARRRLAAGGADAGFLEAKIASANFYAVHVLPRAHGLRDTVLHGAASVMALGEDQL